MRTATFESTVDILVKAYLNDTLVHNNCYACAVGNIVAHNMGLRYEACRDAVNMKIVFEGRGGFYYGSHLPGGHWLNVIRRLQVKGYKDSQAEIDSTGYTINQLESIENAFENASDFGDYMFNGLMAVVDCLAEIHSVDLSIKENAKLLFVKSPN